MTTDHLQSFVQRVFPESYNAREKDIIRHAFAAGRAYEASLFADVINTIVLELKRYRAATVEAKTEVKDTDNANASDLIS